MPINLDTRDYKYVRDFNDKKAERAASGNQPERHNVKIVGVNPFTGCAEQLQSVYSGRGGRKRRPLTDKELIDRAQEHLKLAAPALGFGAKTTPEFTPDPHLKRTSAGTCVVNLRQYHRGIPVFQMERAVWMEANGAIQNVTGASVGLPDDLQVLPAVTLEQAAIAAAQYVASPGESIDAVTKQPIPHQPIAVENFQPRVLAKIPLPSQPAVLDQGPFGEAIPAHLVFFYQGKETRLGWHLVLSKPGLMEQYVVIIEADSKAEDPKHPKALYGWLTSHYFAPARGLVWLHNPGLDGQRQFVDFPRPAGEYPIAPLPKLPDGFPFAWINDGGHRTEGNNTIAVLQNSFQGTVSDDILTFEPADGMDDDQKVLNLFYFCNYLHDFFFMLGFDEAAENFQQVNRTGAGLGGDAVLARVFNQHIPNTATMSASADGQTSVLSAGLAPSPATSPARHCALDSDVIFHEYTHGVTNRLVGSQLDPRPFQTPLAQALAEGWSDYFALTIKNCHLQNENTVIGDWAYGLPEGIRLARYDDDFATNGGTFGSLGFQLAAAHDMGALWCATLMKLNRDLGKALGDRKKGHWLGWQIVIDSLKLLPSNPNCLQARDAILHALNEQKKKKKLKAAVFKPALRAFWGAFAHFGMGPSARFVAPDSLQTIEDKNLPPNL